MPLVECHKCIVTACCNFTPEMANSIISIRGVSKNYASHQALKSVSFEIPEGKIFGLLGPNGAGKTSLIRILNRITAPDEGEVFFRNEPLQAKHLAQIGYLPEERGLYKKMKVLEQMLYFAELRGMNRTEGLKRAKEWIERFGMQGWEQKKIEELSKGMQQKVQFVITVMHQPDLLILDEPFSGFDPVNAEAVKQEILRFRKEGKTVIFSSHRMESVEELCDTIGIIHRSNKLFEGSINELREMHRSHQYEAITRVSPDASKFSIASSIPVEGGFYKTLFAPMNEDEAMALLKSLSSSMYVRSFGEKIPGMHEIFVNMIQNASSHE